MRECTVTSLALLAVLSVAVVAVFLVLQRGDDESDEPEDGERDDVRLVRVAWLMPWPRATPVPGRAGSAYAA
jgi:hypothetical protein